MEILKKPLSVILGLIAAAVLFHFVFTPFYEGSVDAGSIWTVLNWFMALGVVIALAVTYADKRATGTGGSGATAYACANAAFYAAAALALLFFWNWFDSFTAGDDGQSQTRRVFWPVIDVWFIMLVGAVSARLWREGARPQE